MADTAANRRKVAEWGMELVRQAATAKLDRANLELVVMILVMILARG